MKGHLDGLNSIVKWALFVTVAFWWAGIQDEEVITALGMNIPLSYALWVAVAVYLGLNLVVLDAFLRIGDLVNLADDSHLPKLFAQMALHPWPLNPFSYFEDSLLSRLHSAKGFGGLILIWWVANSSLYSLSTNAFSPLGILLQGVFLAIGVSTIIAVNRVYGIILKRTGAQDQKLCKKLRATRIERVLLTFAGIGLGSFFAFATQVAGLL